MFACSRSTARTGIGLSEVILKVYQELGCDGTGLQESRRDGQCTFTAAGYTVLSLGQTVESTKRGGPMEFD